MRATPLILVFAVAGCFELPIAESDPEEREPEVAEAPVRSSSWWRHPKWPQLIFAQARLEEPPDDIENSAMFLHDRGPYRADCGPSERPLTLGQGWSAPLGDRLVDAVNAEFVSLDIEIEQSTAAPFMWTAVPLDAPFGAPEADLTLRWTHDANDVYVDAFFSQYTEVVPTGIQVTMGDGEPIGTFEPVAQLSTWLVSETDPGLDLVFEEAVYAFDAQGSPDQPVGCMAAPPDAGGAVVVQLVGFEERYGASPLKVELATVSGRELGEPMEAEHLRTTPRLTAVIGPPELREDWVAPPLVFTVDTPDGVAEFDFDVFTLLDPSRPPGMTTWPARGVDIDGDGDNDVAVEAATWGTQLLVSVEDLGLPGTLARVRLEEQPDRSATFVNAGDMHVFQVQGAGRSTSVGLRATLDDGSVVPVQCTTTR